MGIVQTITGSVRITENLSVGGTIPPVSRSSLVQDAEAVYVIPWAALRVFDAYGTNLPATPANDDLGLVGGTFGSASPKASSGDVKAGGCTRYARFQFDLPPEYEIGQTVKCRLHAGMTTTPADTSATVDVQCYESDSEAGVGSDLCSTAAQSINNLTDADYDFTIDPAGLAAGDTLDIRITVTVVDAATGTAVIADIGKISMLVDIKG